MTNLTMSCLINICQNNGKCLISVNHTTTASYCLCNRCFTGNQCEIERYSKNLWDYGISEANLKDYNPYNKQIIRDILGIISIVSNLLALQTFLFSKKIRKTNLGIYLILFSLTGLIAGITESVYAFIDSASDFNKLSELSWLILCALGNVFQNLLYFCIYWFCLYIAVERVLIEYSFVSLHDSRRRSVISSILLFILIPLTHILPILFGRKGYSYNSYDFCVLSFTSTGYIFYSIFYYINYITAPLSFTIACVFIFNHLIKHRHTLVNDESFCSSFILIARKHYDFFLPPIIYFLITSPYFILDKLMDCLRADSIVIYRTQAITLLLANGALSLSFFVYVYLSEIYLGEFWQTSPFGQFLIYIKKRFINCCRCQKITVDGERLLRTYSNNMEIFAIETNSSSL